MLILIGILIFIIYAFIMGTRFLDPLSHVVKLPYIFHMGLGLLVTILMVITLYIPDHRILGPMAVYLFFEFLISLAYRIIEDKKGEDDTLHLHGLYIRMAPYFLIFPVSTLGGIVWMICTK